MKKTAVYSLDFRWTIFLALAFAILGKWWEFLLPFAIGIAIMSLMVKKEEELR